MTSASRTTFTKLSLPEITAALGDVARDAAMTFGRLDEHALNWRPGAAQWSIAECFDHLVKGNALVVAAARAALTGPPTSVWQRLPLWPAIFGSLLIRSQSPGAGGKYQAPKVALPSTSQIPGDIVQRFIDQHEQAMRWTQELDAHAVTRAIMISPFIKTITYSVLDGLRLLVAHDRRHFEQARRVMQARDVANSHPVDA